MGVSPCTSSSAARGAAMAGMLQHASLSGALSTRSTHRVPTAQAWTDGGAGGSASRLAGGLRHACMIGGRGARLDAPVESGEDG